MAVKIKTAEDSIDNSELSMLRYLNQQGGSDPMSTHVATLLDCLDTKYLMGSISVLFSRL